jgi:hypothetical protein
MADLNVYDSNEFSVTLGSVTVNSGRGGGVFHSLKPLAPDYVIQRGADGEATASKSNNRGGTVELTVMQNSQAHKDLHALRALGLASTNGASVVAYQARDRLNGLRFEAEKAIVTERPAEDFGREAGERTWKIELAEYTVTDETAGA